jgi:ABC-type hemin transport system substrate-binding protein
MTSGIVVDATAAELPAGPPAQRVVSLVPSLTETVALLGRAQALVGVTPYCPWPAGASARAAVVGGPRDVDLDLLTFLRPDLVLACKEECSRGDVERARAEGLRVYVAWPRRVSDLPGLLGDLGLLLGAADEAARVGGEIRSAVAEAELRLGLSGEPPPTVLCPLWLDPPMAVGRGTYAADLLRLAGGSVVPEREGYPRFAPAEVDPDVVLLPSEPHPFAREDLARLGLGACRAALEGRVHLVDGRQLFWYGPRAAAALGRLRGILGVTRPS